MEEGDVRVLFVEGSSNTYAGDLKCVEMETFASKSPICTRTVLRCTVRRDRWLDFQGGP